jgi:hypothetical protein
LQLKILGGCPGGSFKGCQGVEASLSDCIIVSYPLIIWVLLFPEFPLTTKYISVEKHIYPLIIYYTLYESKKFFSLCKATPTITPCNSSFPYICSFQRTFPKDAVEAAQVGTWQHLAGNRPAPETRSKQAMHITLSAFDGEAISNCKD